MAEEKKKIEVGEIVEKERMQVLAAVAKRKKAKELEEQAKSLKEDANTFLEGIMVNLGVDTILTKLGSVSRVSRMNRSIDLDKMKECMLKAGLSTKKIEWVVNSAVKYNPSTSVQFRLTK
jgi:hypothetical protein